MYMYNKVIGSHTKPIVNEYSSQIYLGWIHNTHGYCSATKHIGLYDGKEVGEVRDNGLNWLQFKKMYFANFQIQRITRIPL